MIIPNCNSRLVVRVSWKDEGGIVEDYPIIAWDLDDGGFAPKPIVARIGTLDPDDLSIDFDIIDKGSLRVSE